MVVISVVIIPLVAGWLWEVHVVGANGREAGQGLVMCVCRSWKNWWKDKGHR